MQKGKEMFSETTEDEAEDGQRIDKDQREDIQVQKADVNQEEEKTNEKEQETAQIGQCAICHIIIDDENLGGSIADSEQDPRWSESYLLCQRCIRNCSIQSDIEHPRRSHASFFFNKDNDRGDLVRSRMYNSHRDQWTRNFNKAPIEINKRTLNYESDIFSYITDRDRNNSRREEQMESCRRQCQQQRSYCNLTMARNSATDRYTEIKVKSSSVDCSRRPIHCPRLDCSVNVAFSALTHHFLFDHPEVPILRVEPGAERTLVVSYGALSCNSSRCLALLLVSGKLSDSSARLFGGNQIHPKYRNRLPLPVLAARLHNNRNYTCCEEVHAGGEGQGEKDMIIAWVAGLDVGDTADRLRCSIQAIDSIENGGFRSLTYTGPVTSLRTAQCPRDVFLAGDCIVLHEGLISHITSGCTSLNVNVTVH
ncbi:hypothetical protein PUN28_013887 [Cardiocondyla obscurior]